MTAQPGVRELIREELRDLAPYESGVAWDRVVEELGIPSDEIAKLDSNENPYGPPPLVRERLAEAELHRYPDMDQLAVRAAVASYIGVASENILGGNGSDELIDLLVRLTCRPGDKLVLPTPTFSMYGIYAEQHGVQIVEAPRRTTDWSLDLEAMVTAVTPAVRAIFLASPNNPTGNILSRHELDTLLGLGPLVVVDEAYGEFAEEQVAPRAAETTNLAVLRTFSKWGAMAGLRAGYVVASAEIVEKLMVMKSPFNMSVPAQVGAVAAIQSRDWLDERAALIRSERQRMTHALATLPDVHVWPSQANYVLARFAGRAGRSLRDELRRQGVFTRHFDHPALADCLRITAGRPQDTDRLLSALGDLGYT